MFFLSLVIGSFLHDRLTYLCPIIPTHPIPFLSFLFSCVTVPSSSSLSRIATVTVFIVFVSNQDLCLSRHPGPTLCRHPFHFSAVIVHAPVVSGLLVQSAAGNFLLIAHLAIPCIPGMLPGTTGGPARCEGVCYTRQTLRPTDTIHTSSRDPLMRMDSVIDEQKEDEEPGRKGRGRHKRQWRRGRNSNVCELGAKNRKFWIAFISKSLTHRLLLIKEDM